VDLQAGGPRFEPGTAHYTIFLLMTYTPNSQRPRASERWPISWPLARASSLPGNVHALLTEAGVAIPPAVSTSGLRELSPLLHQRGPAALVEAWALVSERVDGRPSARAIRRVLLEADLPALSAADLSSRRGALADLADRLAGARAQLGRLRP
jgi:hypothetical protein